MNTAVVTSPAPSRPLRRPAPTGGFLHRVARAFARLRPARAEELDPRTVHELRQEAARLREEGFRAVTVGRLI